MNILILQGSPRLNGNTCQMVDAFCKGVSAAGHHHVDVVNVFEKKIGDCRACEYCHTRGHGKCIQQDDMQDIYPLLLKANMVVFASPIYYHGITGQLKCTIDRFYACVYPSTPPNLQKAALLLNSGAADVYEGAIYSFKNDFIVYSGLQNMGIFTACGPLSPAQSFEIEQFGASL